MPMSLSDTKPWHECPTCCGDGGDFDDSSKPCDDCNGVGRIPSCTEPGCELPRAYIGTRCPMHKESR